MDLLGDSRKGSQASAGKPFGSIEQEDYENHGLDEVVPNEDDRDYGEEDEVNS